MMSLLEIYLHFNGNCREAFDFYSRVLGGKIEFMQTYGEAPGGENMPADGKGRIMHILMNVDGTKIMGSDAPAGHVGTIGSNFSITVNARSEGDAERFFNGLAEGGNVTMPLAETFWSKKFGMLTDKFGVQWMVNYAEVKETA